MIRDAGELIESALKDLYEAYFPKMSPARQKVLIHYMEEKYAGLSYRKLGFGQLYGMFTAQKIWNDISEQGGVIENRFKLLALDKLSHLVSLRNDAVHNHYKAEKTEADFALNYTASFLHAFTLFEFSREQKSKGLQSSLDTLLATEVLLGEVQLYDSLNQVLQDEDIDSVDVTYFSDVIPGLQTQAAPIQQYWSSIASAVNNGTITLRRVVSLPGGSGRSRTQKALWVLLSQFPRYYDKINEGQVSISIIEVSNLQIPDKPVETSLNGIPLINLILLYSKKDPSVGHAWLFGSHDKQGGNQVYLHVAGKGGFSALRSMYDNLFASGTHLTARVAKDMMEYLTRKVNLASEEFRHTVESKRTDFGLSESDAQLAIEFWSGFSDQEHDDLDDYF
ncbi:hypothetical protein AL013_04505 [Mariprofundus ferrooxydans]|uniref:Uncharacterized protein n=1 Tax=Mariprofundus ferrooxydans PV-1 TaxID=314345 RepID=Q0EY61_9PROT|nr:hypothetical protein SPV1_05372 [Mariprofundus ferrooxydans PV-1]KON48019.1 hypothetical protein AL013_04505 [Mariprofundus ferrooxydans]